MNISYWNLVIWSSQMDGAGAGRDGAYEFCYLILSKEIVRWSCHLISLFS